MSPPHPPRTQPSSSKASARRKTPAAGAPSFDRVISVLNLAVTALLALAALWLGHTYNQNEQINRNRETQREERRDAVAARVQMEAATASCIQYNIDLSREQQIDPNVLFRAAVARQIASYTVNCSRIGQPIDERIAATALNRLSASREPVIARAAAEALRTIRRQRSAPPSTLRERAAAYRALGGRAYYIGRGEVEIPLGADARSLGLRPSFYVDVGAVYEVGDPSAPTEPSAQPADRFFQGEPEIRGFDIRGTGPRVSRVPVGNDADSVSNAGTEF